MRIDRATAKPSRHSSATRHGGTVREPDRAAQKTTNLTAINPKEARCPGCGQEFAPPPTVVTAIRDAEAPGLLSQCLNCRRRLLFNPFFAADDTFYTQLLRRGLERSRREKGNDHEETLAHLAALAVNLEEQGKPEEAAELKRENDTMAARVEAERT